MGEGGGCVEGEVHRRMCMKCVVVCERRTNVCGHVRNLSGMCIMSVN